MRRFRVPLSLFETSSRKACGTTASRAANWRNKTRIGPRPSRRAPSEDFKRQPPPFALQFIHRPASGVTDDGLWGKPNTIALPPRPFTPILVLRDAVDEVANGIEDRTPHEHRCRDRELEVPDVALVAERENALEGLGRRHPLWILNKDVDTATGDIRVTQFRQTLLKPALIWPTIAVDESERIAPRSANPGVASGSGAALGNLDHLTARPNNSTNDVKSARAAVVDDDNFRPIARKALRLQQSQTGVQIVVIVEVRHDHRDETDDGRLARRLKRRGLFGLTDRHSLSLSLIWRICS